MFSNRNSALELPNSNGFKKNQYLCPALSCEHLLAPPPSFHSHYKSEPNVAYYFSNQTEQRRLSDGPYPPSLRRSYPYHYYHRPGELSGKEPYMFKRKNSSLNMILDSTSSMMRTATSTVQCLLGSARRASYCGLPDPSVQLSPNGVSGSLYLRPATANSDESELSNISYDEQRRLVTIYDGRVPTAPVPPTIPFELMTPLEAITKTVEDPIESFVQIVLEKPDDKPPIMPPIPVSPSETHVLGRRRHRSSSPRPKSMAQELSTISRRSELPRLTQHLSMPTKDIFNSNHTHCPTPTVIEPMDFSFLDPVLRGESAAPPPPLVKNSSLSYIHSQSPKPRKALHQNNLQKQESPFYRHTPSYSTSSSDYVTSREDDVTLSGTSIGDSSDCCSLCSIRR